MDKNLISSFKISNLKKGDEDYEMATQAEAELRRNFDEIDPNIYDRLARRYYQPSDSCELYDYVTDTYYNIVGDELRDTEEYNANTEGYTPFGDE